MPASSLWAAPSAATVLTPTSTRPGGRWDARWCGAGAPRSCVTIDPDPDPIGIWDSFPPRPISEEPSVWSRLVLATDPHEAISGHKPPGRPAALRSTQAALVCPLWRGNGRETHGRSGPVHRYPGDLVRPGPSGPAGGSPAAGEESGCGPRRVRRTRIRCVRRPSRRPGRRRRRSQPARSGLGLAHQLGEQARREDRSRGAPGVSERQSAALGGHVPGRGRARRSTRHLSRESLVELHDVDRLEVGAGACQRRPYCGDDPDAGAVGVNTGRRGGDDPQTRQPQPRVGPGVGEATAAARR